MDRRDFLAALAALPAVGACGLGCAAIDIRGSDSEVSLVERLADAFMQRNREISISVTGGGSGVGIAAMLDATIDICTSSREMQPLERLLALRKRAEPIATVFATDALSVIVHADNPLASLDLDSLGAIYRGEQRDWSFLAGARGGPVVCYGRQSSSGTYGFFKSAVVKGEYGSEMRQMSGNSHILEAIARDPGGIGYVAVGVLGKAQDLAVRAIPVRKNAGGHAVSPLDRPAVLAGEYPIARPLLQFTNGQPRGVVRDFLRFELSPDGEALVEEMGFYPVVTAWRDRNAHLLGVA